MSLKRAFKLACKDVCEYSMKHYECPYQLLDYEDDPALKQLSDSCKCDNCDGGDRQTPHCWEEYFMLMARKEAGKEKANDRTPDTFQWRNGSRHT